MANPLAHLRWLCSGYCRADVSANLQARSKAAMSSVAMMFCHGSTAHHSATNR